MQLLNRLIEWLEKHLAEIVLAFNAGVQIGIEKSQGLKKKLLLQETETKLLKARLEIVKKYVDISSSDAVDAAISEGERLAGKVSERKANGSDSDGKN